MIDMSAEDEYGNPQPQLHTIPDGDLGTGTYARRINNNGDVLGSFVIDDATWGWYLFNPGLHGDTPYELKVLPLATITNTCVSERLCNRWRWCSSRASDCGQGSIGSGRLPLLAAAW